MRAAVHRLLLLVLPITLVMLFLTMLVNPAGVHAAAWNTYQITDSAANNTNIDVAIGPDGLPHAVYERNGNVYYCLANGSEELVASGSNPAIAVGPNGVPQLVYIGSTGQKYTTKSGGAWQTPIDIWSANSQIDIEVDSNNNAHIVFLGNFYTDGDSSSYADVGYTVMTNGTPSGPNLIWAGWYYWDGYGGGANYFESPRIKVDSNGYYHISSVIHVINRGMGWIDHNYYVIYQTNLGGVHDIGGPGFGNSSFSLPRNAMAIGPDGKTYVAYYGGGAPHYTAFTPDPSAMADTVLSGVSAPAIASNDTFVGLMYENAGSVYLMLDEGTGFVTPTTIDTGSAPALALSNNNFFAYYLKSDGTNNEVFLTTDTILEMAPVITDQPDNATVQYGDDAVFTASASGIPTPTVQWQVDYGMGFVNIDGATSATLTVPDAVMAYNGAQFRAVFTNTTSGGQNDVATDTALLTVNPRIVTPAVTVESRTYDGTTDAFILSRSLGNTLVGDDVSLAGGAASFEDKNIGDGKTVVVTGLGLSGTDASNYTLSSTSATANADINHAPLAPSVTVGSKTYDNTTDTVIETRMLLGTIFGLDDVSLAGGAAAFGDEHVGVGKEVTVTGLSLAGTDSSNYALSSTSSTATADITKRTINVSAQSETKTYDGTANCFLAPNVIGLADGDESGFVQNFGSKHAYASNQVIVASGSAVDGNGGNNYEVVFQNNSGRINRLPITVTAVPDTKTYDGTTTSSGIPTTSVALAAGDTAGFSQNFADANAGEEKTLIPGGYANDGNDGNNYNYTFVTNNNGEILKAAAQISLSNLTHVYDGTSKTPTLTTDPPGLVADVTFNGLATTPVNAGSYALVVTINDNNYTGEVTDTFVISKADPVVNWAPAGFVYNTPLGAEHLNATAEIAGSFTYDPATGAILGAGTRTLSATFTPTDAANYNTVTVTRDIVITKATASVLLDGLNQTYDGSPKAASSATSPAGFTVDITYDGSITPPTNAGDYTVVGTVSDANYEGTATGTLHIEKAEATVTLGSLTHVYDGTGKAATATTSPIADMPLVFLYDGDTALPVNAGSHQVVATINHQNYHGSATDYLFIDKATASIAFDNLTFTYNGAPQPVTAATTPGGLTVSFTYDSQPVPPTNAGSYTVVASISELNYQGIASATMTIGKATAAFNISGLNQTYDGTPREIIVETVPSGIAYTVTYDGSPPAPINAGEYSVVVTITDANYTGSIAGSLFIQRATPTVTWNTPDSITYGNELDETQLNATAAVSGAFIYNPPAGTVLNAGGGQELSVEFTPVDSLNYNKVTQTVTINVNKASANVAFADLEYIYDGSAKQATVTTDPSALTVTVTYNGSTTTPTNAGTFNVRAEVVDANYEGVGTAVLVIDKASASLEISGLNHVYDRTAKSVSVVTGPANLPVSVTYNGSAVAPTAAGSYAVSVTVSDVNYQASSNVTMVIAKSSVTPSVAVADKTYDGTTSATISGRSLAGVITGDAVILSGGTAAFDNAAVGNDKTVTVTGLTLTGANAGNYALSATTVTTTADINEQQSTGGGGGGFGSQLVGIGLSGNSPWMDGNGRALTEGWIRTEDGLLSLTIPVGTYVWNAAGAGLAFLSAGEPSSSMQPPPNSIILRTYELGPSGATFNPTITLTMSYTFNELPAGVAATSLYIAWWDGVKWVKLDSTVDAAARTITARVSHFTTFALIAQQPPPPTTTTPPPSTTVPPTTTAPAPTTTAPPPTTAPPASTTQPTFIPEEENGDSMSLLPIGLALAGASLLLGIILFKKRKPTS